MPALQLTPPGHLEMHVVVVASTPAILALLGGIVTAIAGGTRAARALGWFCTLSGIALLVVFLRPGGVAASYTYPLAYGWMRVGPWQILAAILSGLWAAVLWRPGHAQQGPIGWGVRTALALVLPLSLVVIGASAADLDPQPHLETRRWPQRALRLMAIALLSVAAAPVLLAHAHAGDLVVGEWQARLSMAVACFCAVSGSPRAWGVPMTLAALAALLPLSSP